MTQLALRSLETRRIRAIAQEYRDKGYDVMIGPNREDRPEFLAEYDIDLYAQNGEDHAIVEVKTRDSLSKSKYLPRLAELLQNRPGWRLELVVTNRREDVHSEEPADLLSPSEAGERLCQAAELLAQGLTPGAMLLAWTATEAALRLVAENNDIRLKEQSPCYIIKQLYSLGALDREQYNLLDEAIRVRNTIIHGYKLKVLAPLTVTDLIREAENLLQSRSLQFA